MAVKKSASPAKARAVAAKARASGFISGNAVLDLINRFREPTSAEAFAKWRTLPETQLFVSALREIALCPSYTRPDAESYEVQFGVTQGYQGAAMLLDDPSSIFAEIFSGGTPAAGADVATDYTVPPDGETGAD